MRVDNREIATSKEIHIAIQNALNKEFFEFLVKYSLKRLHTHSGIKYNFDRGIRGIMIEDMIQQILKDNKIDLLSLQEHAIATLSCKASLKGNSHLSIESMQTIVDNLMRCDNPYVCPHGRPTIIHYSAYELEKLFKRVV